MSQPPPIEYDRAGFPMAWVEEIQGYLHWLPVSKIQFEHFLCDVTDRAFDAAWYDRILELNPRRSPRDINERNYWQAFLTGVQPAEVERFARWCGEEYSIPTLEQWNLAYKTLKELPTVEPEWSDTMPLRVRTLLARINTAWERAADKVGHPRKRSGQMLMRLGVMEWVEDSNGGHRWGGMGQPHPDFHGLLFSPDHGKAAHPNHPESDRISYYGFRLVRRVR